MPELNCSNCPHYEVGLCKLRNEKMTLTSSCNQHPGYQMGYPRGGTHGIRRASGGHSGDSPRKETDPSDFMQDSVKKIVEKLSGDREQMLATLLSACLEGKQLILVEQQLSGPIGLHNPKVQYQFQFREGTLKVNWPEQISGGLNDCPLIRAIDSIREDDDDDDES